MKPEQLIEAINKKRDEMIKLGITKGLRCEETIKSSQELDQLLNIYHHTKETEPSKPLNFFIECLVFLRKQIHK